MGTVLHAIYSKITCHKTQQTTKKLLLQLHVSKKTLCILFLYNLTLFFFSFFKITPYV